MAVTNSVEDYHQLRRCLLMIIIISVRL